MLLGEDDYESAVEIVFEQHPDCTRDDAVDTVEAIQHGKLVGGNLKASLHFDRQALYDEWYGIDATLKTIPLPDEEANRLRERRAALAAVLKQYPHFRARIEAVGG